jgi:high-affinity nickel permease
MTTGIGIALVSAGALGLRPGFDYDHLAAITDITSVEPTLTRPMKLGVLYAFGATSDEAVMVSSPSRGDRSHGRKLSVA